MGRSFFLVRLPQDGTDITLCNSSAQDFALAAKSVRMRKFSAKESGPLLKANSKWAGFHDSEAEG